MSFPDSQRLTGEGMPRWEGHLLKFTPWKEETVLWGQLCPHLDRRDGGLCADPQSSLLAL